MSAAPDGEASALCVRHLRVGWTALLVFVCLGVLLEAFHAYRVPLYLDAGNEGRRLLLRLAHAHGTLLAVVNILYALTVRVVPAVRGRATSAALIGALVLVPVGFLLGGVFARGADPGAGAALVPAGAVALVLSLVGVVSRLRGSTRTP